MHRQCHDHSACTTVVRRIGNAVAICIKLILKSERALLEIEFKFGSWEFVLLVEIAKQDGKNPVSNGFRYLFYFLFVLLSCSPPNYLLNFCSRDGRNIAKNHRRIKPETRVKRSENVLKEPLLKSMPKSNYLWKSKETNRKKCDSLCSDWRP